MSETVLWGRLSVVTDSTMSEEPTRQTEDGSDLSRRTFMKGVGVTAGATALGVGASGSAVAHDGFHAEFANWRVREARKVWDRGYRGRPDRAMAVTDSGIEARHPDLGPWNGIQAVEVDEEIRLTRPEDNTYPETERTEGIAGGSFSGQLGPGGPGSDDRVPTDRQTHEFTAPTAEGSDEIDEDIDEVDATMTWTPQAQDNELYLDELVDGEWKRRAQSMNFNPSTLAGESLTAEVTPGNTYRFVAETYANAGADYEIEYSYARVEVISEGDISYDYDKSDVFADVPEDPDEVTTGTPKTVGWYNETGRYGRDRRPRDGDTPRNNTDLAPGHGSNASSVAAGSGEALAVDTDRYTEDEPRAVLLPTDTVQYEVSARADTSVFATAYGDNIRMTIEGPDGRELADSNVLNDPGILDSVIADTSTVHEEGEATYTVNVIGRDVGGVGVGRLQRIAVGASLQEGESAGDRTGEDPTVHAGLAPNAGLVGFSGLAEPTNDIAEYADSFTDLFNVRAVNMSWSYVDPATGLLTPPYSGTGVELTDPGPSTIKDIAEGGILPVAAASNSFTPAQTSTPALADEAISVVSTDALDGIVSYSSSGIVANDEDGEGQYKKPDVTAPGGDIGEGQDLIRAAKRGDPDLSEAEQGGVRDYAWTAGTSFASPYVAGVSMLVSQAMEFDAPDTIALPEPSETDFEDVMRLKHVILATASETAFTAAPYHDKASGKAPRYTFGGHDIYEGWGRVNPEVAADAVSRDLLAGAADLEGGESTSASYRENVGLNVPTDQRAVGGYVTLRGGTLDVSVEFTHYSGGNAGMTKGNPHLDIFVYDAENPGDNGEPNDAESIASTQGVGDVSLTVPTASPGEEPKERTFFVVVKLVNIPGVVNGYDVQANFDLDLAFEADMIPDVTTEFTASGSRSDDGSVFTAGQTNRVTVTVEDFQNAEEIEVRDNIPSLWDVDEEFGDVKKYDDEEGIVTFEGTVTADQVEGDSEVTFEYFAEAPDTTGRYDFGPAEAEVITADVPGDDTDGELDGDEQDAFGGTDTNTVVGASTET